MYKSDNEPDFDGIGSPWLYQAFWEIGGVPGHNSEIGLRQANSREEPTADARRQNSVFSFGESGASLMKNAGGCITMETGGATGKMVMTPAVAGARKQMGIDQKVNEIVTSSRHDFSDEGFDEQLAEKDPLRQFEIWLSEALEKQVPEPNAMVLSTSTESGRPSSRVVLLRGVSEGGFTFFTNYDSRKSEEIESNPQAALLFYWSETGKQIRIEGTVTRVREGVSDAYFASRPRGNKLGALVSPQSKVINGREELETRYSELETKLAAEEIARPENWGGYVLAPEVYEFWQGRESRLHDRLRYTKTGDGWEIVRLAP